MPRLDPLVEYLLELLAPLPGVTAKRMFGGYGIFRDGLMFGLVADDTLYLKVDAENKVDFTARGLGPFVYMKGNKAMSMSYHQAPSEALDSPDEMVVWAEKAFQAALRAQTDKQPARRKSQRKSNPSA